MKLLINYGFNDGGSFFINLVTVVGTKGEPKINRFGKNRPVRFHDNANGTKEKSTTTEEISINCLFVPSQLHFML